VSEADDSSEVEKQLAPYLIEHARSSRSKCKTCKRAIDKGVARVGVLIEGPFGTGYLWHHLTCLARRQIESVEEAYAGDYTAPGVEKPPIEELRKLADAAEQKRKEKQEAPYVERASTGRSKCAHCGGLIAEGAFRVVVLRSVEFYGQVRNGPIKVHAKCVAAALAEENSATEVDGFADAVRANSRMSSDEIESSISEIGELE
jgi:poly [ADP-ribose] polymerase